ncbi:hypothetical protein GCM10009716_18910 [Streptomyces sodiiphilus]|uniref:Uncharacterized protein n=1 Tax=Streptomyces sodiiphilus TaxID=226217 RepID=A0ABP5AD54_9ACTN
MRDRCHRNRPGGRRGSGCPGDRHRPRPHGLARLPGPPAVPHTGARAGGFSHALYRIDRGGHACLPDTGGGV